MTAPELWMPPGTPTESMDDTDTLWKKYPCGCEIRSNLLDAVLTGNDVMQVTVHSLWKCASHMETENPS